MAAVDRLGIHPVKLAHGRDGLSDDRPGVDSADVDHSACALLAELHSRLLLAAGLVRAATVSLPYLIVPLVLVMIAGFVHILWIPLHLMAFFAGSLACHGALAEMRPPARDLSVFYVTIALGGLLGGIWNALVAPLIFDRVVEYPLALILVCLAAPGFEARDRSTRWEARLGDLLFAGVVFLLTVMLATNQAGLGDSVLGVLGVMVASGLGVLSCVTARRRPIRFALVVAGVMAAALLRRASAAGCCTSSATSSASCASLTTPSKT